MTMLNLYLLFLVFSKSNSGLLPSTTSAVNETIENFFGDTRRIIKGREVFDTRPYMVYLRPTQSHSTMVDQNWLCGGVIIHETYILTSAACIEDIKYFWVVSGTHKWLPQSQTNACIENGAVRAVWKCVHRTYHFDGNVFNNIRWMVNDIAVVMTEGPISFHKRVKGCDFIPQKIQYNNISKEYEEPGTKGFIAGWGSQDRFTDAADILARTSVNSPLLLEAETIIITKENCKHRWLARYHSIIDHYMICGKQAHSGKMSDTCNENHVECRQLVFSEEVGPRVRRFEGNPDEFIQNSAAEVRKREQAKKKTRRMNMFSGYGGFCENDHGGPLVVGRGKSSLVVGIMSTYKVENNSKFCTGPFLYTSVYNNRQLIHCAIYKEEGVDCAAVLRDESSVFEEETFDWGNFPLRANPVYEEDAVPVLRRQDDENNPSGEDITLADTKTSPSATNAE